MMRRRVGDPLKEDSYCDKKKFFISEWIIPFLMLGFVAINYCIFVFKTSNIDNITSYIYSNEENLRVMEKRNILLLNTKRLFDDYDLEDPIYFEGQDL